MEGSLRWSGERYSSVEDVSSIEVERSKCEFVSKAECELRMLSHVIETEILHQVLGRMDLVVRILKVGLNHER